MMKDDQARMREALEAVREDAHAATDILPILKAQAPDDLRSVPGPAQLQAGIRLVRAIDRLTDAQRDALVFGATLNDSQRTALAELVELLSR